MANEMQVFSFQNTQVRIVQKEGAPWWVAKDVCEVLDIKNPTQAVDQLDDDERSMFYIGRQGDVNIINESGLYTMIVRSNKPGAKKFRKWVTSEVLPSIRKTGEYKAKANTDILDLQRKRLDIMEANERIRRAKAIQEMIKSPKYPINEESKRVLCHEAARLLAGREVFMLLPNAETVYYSNSDLGKELGISNRKVMAHARGVGIIAPDGQSNEYGRWKMTKSPYSPHECSQWVYNERGRDAIVLTLGGC